MHDLHGHGLCVIALRRKQPQHERPYRVRGGYVVPAVTAVVFGLLMAAIAIDHPLVTAIVGVAAGFCAYYGWRVAPRMRARARRRFGPPDCDYS